MIEINTGLLLLIGAFLASLGGGIWFAATQVAALSVLTRRIDDMRDESIARYARHDQEIQQRDAAIVAVDKRLARIEMQLEYLVAAGKAQPHRTTISDR